MARVKKKPRARRRNAPAIPPTNVPRERLASTRTVSLPGVDLATFAKKARQDHAKRADAAEFEVRELGRMLSECRAATVKELAAPAVVAEPTWFLTSPEPTKGRRRNPALPSIVEAIRRDGRNRQGVRRGEVLGANDPRKSHTVILRPRWRGLKRGKVWNQAVRDACAGRSGVYALRDRASGQVLYVGESHTGRMWKTLLRHFQDPGGRFAKLGEWTHDAPGRLQVSIWLTSHGEPAVKLEARAQRRFRPSQILRQPAPF